MRVSCNLGLFAGKPRSLMEYCCLYLFDEFGHELGIVDLCVSDGHDTGHTGPKGSAVARSHNGGNHSIG